MRRRIPNQLVLDLDRSTTIAPLTPAPEELLQALADLLLEALGKQNQALPVHQEACDAAEDHT